MRKWVVEDRTALAEAVKVAADSLALKLDRDNATTAETLKAHIDTLTKHIEANTELTREAATKADDAYKEANNVNQKIESLGEHLKGKS